MPTSRSKDSAPKTLTGDKTPIDMTPMIDVVFLLIIFFLCVTEMARTEYESLVLPRATRGVLAMGPNPCEVIYVTCHYSPRSEKTTSDIIIRRENFNESARLERHLMAKAARWKDGDRQTRLKVRIRADGSAAYQKVRQVMVACMKAGIREVSFGTAPERPGE